MKPLVGIFAHPDDEAFGPAGTIAHFAQSRDVYILCVTPGDADSQFTTHNTQTLGEVREKELNNSAKILGVKKVECLNYKDGSLCNNLYHVLAATIRTKLDMYQPDTVMTFEPRGISGHLDHIAVSFITTYVFHQLPFLKRLMYFCANKEHIATAKKYFGDYFVYFPPGYKNEEINVTINTTKYWEKRIRAVKAHESQKEDGEKILKLLEELPKEEHFLEVKK